MRPFSGVPGSMRPPLCLLFFLIVGPAFVFGVFERDLQLINAGTEPIYAVRIAQHGSGIWSEDLLASTAVVDVGEVQSIRVGLQGTCWYDIRLEYRDGHADEVDDVDLCSANRLFLKH